MSETANLWIAMHKLDSLRPRLKFSTLHATFSHTAPSPTKDMIRVRDKASSHHLLSWMLTLLYHVLVELCYSSIHSPFHFDHKAQKTCKWTTRSCQNIWNPTIVGLKCKCRWSTFQCAESWALAEGGCPTFWSILCPISSQCSCTKRRDFSKSCIWLFYVLTRGEKELQHTPMCCCIQRHLLISTRVKVIHHTT